MTLRDVKKHLPVGAMKNIAKRTNIHYPEVTRMFQGLETAQTPLVIKATDEYLRELSLNVAQAQKYLQKIISA